MIYMDLDTYSPPSRYQRCTSTKRTRSPDPSIFEDRPSKRIHFAAFDIPRRLGGHSTGSSRQSSEDWVQQARGLSIDCPLYPEPFISEETTKDEQVENDEHMMSVSNSQGLQDLDKPQLPLLRLFEHTTFPSARQVPVMGMSCGLNGPSIPYIPVDSVEDPSFPASVKPDQQYQQALSGTDPSMSPSINRLPQNPLEQLGAQACLHSSSVSASNSGMSTPTYVTPPKLVSQRKPRFMMGPRADCEKCRMGIKGHLVHLD